jgi:hypothetical protein
MLLLIRRNKTNSRVLIWIAGWQLLMRFVDLFWLIAPTFRESLRLHWLDAAAWAAVGGFVVAAFLGFLRRRPLLAAHDPRFEYLRSHPEEVDEGWEAEAQDA